MCNVFSKQLLGFQSSSFVQKITKMPMIKKIYKKWKIEKKNYFLEFVLFKIFLLGVILYVSFCVEDENITTSMIVLGEHWINWKFAGLHFELHGNLRKEVYFPYKRMTGKQFSQCNSRARGIKKVADNWSSLGWVSKLWAFRAWKDTIYNPPEGLFTSWQFIKIVGCYKAML